MLFFFGDIDYTQDMGIFHPIYGEIIELLLVYPNDSSSYCSQQTKPSIIPCVWKYLLL